MPGIVLTSLYTHCTVWPGGSRRRGSSTHRWNKWGPERKDICEVTTPVTGRPWTGTPNPVPFPPCVKWWPSPETFSRININDVGLADFKAHITPLWKNIPSIPPQRSSRNKKDGTQIQMTYALGIFQNLGYWVEGRSLLPQSQIMGPKMLSVAFANYRMMLKAAR